MNLLTNVLLLCLAVLVCIGVLYAWFCCND